MDGYGSDLKASSGFSARNSGSCIVLAANAIPKNITGTLVETEFTKIVVPGGLMGPDAALRIIPLFKYPNNANAKTFKVLFGGMAFSNVVVGSLNTFSPLIVIRNRGATNSQVSFAAPSNTGISPQGSDPTTGAVDTAVDQIISITGILANIADVITLEGYTVEVLNPL